MPAYFAIAEGVIVSKAGCSFVRSLLGERSMVEPVFLCGKGETPCRFSAGNNTTGTLPGIRKGFIGVLRLYTDKSLSRPLFFAAVNALPDSQLHIE
jgi:hypothetical protein